MILRDLECASGHRFEAALPSMTSDDPPCPECGAATRRLISRLNIGGQASAGPSRDDMPMTWNATRGGDEATLSGWRKAMKRREKLEEKYPELAGDRRPVLAHEGKFADAPLRAGDALVPTIAAQAFGKAAPAGGAAAKPGKPAGEAAGGAPTGGGTAA